MVRTIQLHTSIPGPRSEAIVARRRAAVSNGASMLTPVVVERAEGAVVIDVDGNTLLDFAGGIGALAVGHCPPEVVNAIKEQTERLLHMCAIVGTYEPYVQTAEFLNEITPGKHSKKTVLLNTGAEAVEAAVKIARSYTGRQAIIVFEGAYHGRSNMTMAMTSKYALFKKNFGPFAPEVYRLPFPNLYRRPVGMNEEEFIDYAIQQLENALVSYVAPEAVAAIVIEPVQGEGGFIPTPPRFLRRIRELCDEHGIVMVADEVQSGFGRTGRMFAIEHYDIVPDLMTCAKSLAAGLPLSAVVGRAEIMDAVHAGGLGGTYSGNPLACAAAIEAIQIIRQPAFLQRAADIGKKLKSHLEQLKQQTSFIGDVRGLGAMLAIELVEDHDKKTPAAGLTARVTHEACTRGLIVIRAGLFANCVRLLPPLNITDDQIDEGLTVLNEAVHAACVPV